MKKLMVAALLAIVTASLSAQSVVNQVYTRRVLEVLGLEQNEIDQVLAIQEESAASIRRLQAEQEIRKAELARLLLDEEPNMRLVERNLRATADIEVEIRLVEIRREVEIRKIIGTDRWARILQTIRQRREELAQQASETAQREIAELQQTISEKQRELEELIQSSDGVLSDEEIRRQFQELQQQYQELQRLIRERL